MNGRPGRPGTPRSGSSRPGGGYRPSGPRRPGGSGGNSDNVLPVITGLLGSSILAFSLYVFSHNPGLLGEIVHGTDDCPDHPTVYVETSNPAGAACEPAAGTCQSADEAYQPYSQDYQSYGEASESATDAVPVYNHPKISIEKKKWLTNQEEELIKDRREREKKVRGKLRKELSEHLQKVKEIRDELHKEKKSRYPWD